MTFRNVCSWLFIAVIAGFFGSSTAIAAETRRAFIIGIERYSDGFVQRLGRANTDARDIAKDLEQVGFDKKNIKLATDIKSKADFGKQFDDFLKTVQEGDTVLFFFSGHGFGVDADNANYLLFSDLKSPIVFARSKMTTDERKDINIVRLRAPSYLDEYEKEEIPKNGISVSELQTKIAAKKPKTAILVLDACRSIAVPEPGEQTQQKPGEKPAGSRLLASKNLPEGFITIYSASFGEQAVESFGPEDQRRNSLFSEVFRAEMQRPGQTIIQLGDRVRLAVRSIAAQAGYQQEPEYFENLGNAFDFALIDGIGAERFPLPRQDKCEEAKADWAQIVRFKQRESLDRHRRRFEGCPTAELARRELVNLSESTDDVIPVQSGSANQVVDPCDQLAASDQDRTRPPEVSGVPFASINAAEAIRACTDATQRNPRIIRFLFNLGRAQQALANQLGPDDPARADALRKARLALDDATKRGYVVAMHNLALLESAASSSGVEQKTANDYLKRAAQQGLPIAMYNLALRYKFGTDGIPRDVYQAYAWFARAADAGLVSAMVETGQAILTGLGVDRQNPRRGAEWLQRAADAGSVRASYLLGFYHFNSFIGQRSFGQDDLPKDQSLGMLWYGRAAEAGNVDAQLSLAQIMIAGSDILAPQPEIAERYWRLAAAGGNATAQYELAERLRSGHLLIRPENGSQEAVSLLQRSLAQGSTRAALELARIYRNGDLNEPKDAVKAMQYAYHAIKLATETDPKVNDGNPFYEISAGILLSEMVANNEAIGADGRSLLSKDEIERLEKYYGRVDPTLKQVKVRRLVVPLECRSASRQFRFVWVWDWDRSESPTEAQFRQLERATRCNRNRELRETLISSFETARKNKVAFADLIDQQVKSAKAVADAAQQAKTRRGR